MKAKLRQEGSETVVTFSGELNERAEETLSSLAPSLSGNVVFDWGGVSTINSLGAGYWIEFLGAIARVTSYRFVNATVGFVSYANAIEAFVGKGAVETFEVPLYCAKCDQSSRVMGKAADAEPPRSSCAKCKGAREPEIEWSSYVTFLKR